MEKKIIFLHGFGSSGQSGIADYLRKKMPEVNVTAPDIPIDPKEALPYLQQLCGTLQPDLIIGTSMGAMYALQMHGFRRICVNPALRMSELNEILKVGTFPYFCPTSSGKTHFTITEEIIEHFCEMERHMYDELTDESRQLCWGFFGDSDDVVNFRSEFLRYFYPHVLDFHGGHSLTNAVLRDVIIPFAKMLIDEETTDEWGVTYSSYGRILKHVDRKRFICEEYTIPKGVEIIKGEFACCKNLRTIHLPSTLREMEGNTFLCSPIREIELPEGITKVTGCMCEGCKELERVHLPSTIVGIEIAAFNGCWKLSEINLPDSIIFLEEKAFSNCPSLRHITLPPKLEWICPELFANSGIESIEIHSNISKICNDAFWECDNLKSLTIPSTVKEIESGIVSAHEGFEGVVCHAKGYHVENEALIDDNNHEMLCCWTTQKDYVVPECVRRISTFSGNPFVETITIRQPIELMPYEPFAANPNLRDVHFFGGVDGLKEGSFYNCPNLNEELKKYEQHY